LRSKVDHKRIDWGHIQRRRSRTIQHPWGSFHLQDMCPLFFATHTPMLYVQEDRDVVAHLEVTPLLLLHKGVFFSDGNCASPATDVFYDLEDLECLDWDIILFERNCWSREYKRVKAAEVLVPEQVHPVFIKRIHVRTEIVRLRVEAALREDARENGDTSHKCEIVVSPDLYEF